MKTNTFYRAIASALTTIKAIDSRAGRGTIGEQESRALSDLWSDYLQHVIREHAPSGSGFDKGTEINLDRSRSDALFFETAFHHMNEHGFYDGWTTHAVTVRPGFDGVSVRVTGRDRNSIKDYIAEQFITLDTVVVPTYGEWLSARRAKAA